MVSDVHADLAPQVMNPLGIEGADWPKYATLVGSALLFLVGIPLAVLSLFLRMRRARDVERTQLQWLFLGGIVLVVGIVFEFGGTGDQWGFAVGLCGLPVAIGVGMLRHGLFDVELTLNRTVVFGLLTGFVVAAYVLAVYVVDAVAPGSRWGVLVVAGAALAAAAARDRVQEIVDRRLFGHRHNPYAVVAHVGSRRRRGVPAGRGAPAAARRAVRGAAPAVRRVHGRRPEPDLGHLPARQPGGDRDGAGRVRRRAARRAARAGREVDGAAGGSGRGGRRPRRHPRVRRRAGHRHRPQPRPDRGRA